MWELVWAGHLTNDTLAPLRARLSAGRTTHRGRTTAPRPRYVGGRYGAPRSGAHRFAAGTGTATGRSAPPSAVGRWALVPPREADPTIRAHATAEILLERHGIVTRGATTAERVPGGFAGVYRVLAAFEAAGRVRRGYFVEGLGAAQFGVTGAVDRLRSGARPEQRAAATLVLAAADPANAFGAALPWPERPIDESAAAGTSVDRPGHRPGRKAGALVVIVDGRLILYVERGGRSLLSWTQDPELLRAAADALALAVRDGALGRLTVERADGAGLLADDHPVAAALAAAGFHATPRGLRMRG